METRTHWLFPVLTTQPDELIQGCRRAGFDAARGATSVLAVAAPPDRPEADPVNACRMMAGLVFLPAYPELRRRALARLAAAVALAASSGPHAEPASHRLRQA